VAASLALYGGSPFFSYPYKPILNQAIGSGYERAYAHFRRDHQDPANLAIHLGCLVLQLGANFSLLAEIDDAITDKAPLVSVSTALLWGKALVMDSSAPAAVKAMSVASLLLAFKYRKAIRGRWKNLIGLQAGLEVLGFQTLVLNGGLYNEIPFSQGTFLRMLIARYLLQIGISKFFSGKLEASKTKVNVLLLAFMLKTSMDPFGKVPPFLLGLVGWMLSLLTTQRWLYFYSCGFLATVTQGVSHHLSGERATMPGLSLLADELAHSTFFPTCFSIQCTKASMASRK